MMNLHEATFCGDYCGKCPNYPDRCRGCVPSYRQNCHFIRCCTSKGIEHCGLCNEFPCPDLLAFVPDDRPECPPGFHIENLMERKAVGTEAWLESQKKKWRSG